MYLASNGALLNKALKGIEVNHAPRKGTLQYEAVRGALN